MILRPRQATFVERCVDAITKHGNTLGVAPTGAGKTIMLSAVVGKLPGKGLILQHRDELTEQNATKFRRVNPGASISIYDSKTKNWNGNTVFGMVQTVVRNLDKLPRFDSVTVDEAHHSTATSYLAIINRLRELDPKTMVLGVTATPNRGDGKPMREVFSNVADQITIAELIQSGHLVRPRTFVIDVGATEELRNVRKLASDFDMAEVARIMDRELITDKVIEHWREKAGERQTVVFCSTVAHAEHVCEAFQRAGAKAAVVRGDMGSAARAECLAAFKRGAIQVIVNVAVLTEGFDHPPVSCVVLLRPSSFKSTMVQMIGRGLRTVHPDEFPGVVKTDCIVLDFGTSSLTHGSLEDDVNLDGKTKGEAPTKECPECGGLVPISTRECPLCGYIFPEPEAKEKSELGDFVMTEIDLLAQSNFKWVDIWGDDRGLIAAGMSAWAGLFWWQGIWHAVGGSQATGLRHLGVGERVVALALADDYLNEHEDGSTAHKSKRWLREPASSAQLFALGINEPIPTMSKYQASCRITFKKAKKGIINLVTSYGKELAA